MKKFVKNLILVVLSALCVAALVAVVGCNNSENKGDNNNSENKADYDNGENSKDTHTHNYTVQVTPPTCTERGYTTRTCACGDYYVDDYVNALGHNYSPQVTPPTCTERGYTTRTCACGDYYVDDYVGANGHNFINNICSVCEYTKPTENIKITAIYLNKTTLSLYIDDCETLAATILPTNATETITWISTVPTVATVMDGKITGISEGTATIIASSPSGKNVTCQVTVTENTNGLVFTEYGDGYAVTGYTDTESSVTVPSTYKGKPVTAIGTGSSNGFFGCKSLVNVVLPDSILSICYGAFANCSNLDSIIIGKNVTTIDGQAFFDCNRLKSLTIPDGVTSIGNYAFKNCSSLESVTIGNGVTSIGRGVFMQCSNITSITIPDSVTSIAYDALNACSSLESISLPFVGTKKDGISETNFGYIFGASSYSNNSNYVPSSLKTVNITGGNSIASLAFYKCSNIESITISESVTSIGSSAFSGCSSLESLVLPFIGNTVKASSNTYQYPFGYIFGTSSYTGGTATEQYYYGNSTSNTTSTTYYIPATLKEVTITGGNILLGAFYNCSKLTSVTIPNSVTSIGNYAFKNCSSLESITIPDSVISIGREAFYGCSNLQCNKYDNASYLGNDTNNYVVLFKARSTNIAVCEINNNTKVIYDYAFSGCSKLKSIAIPNSVKDIGDNVFNGCSSLTNLTIPSGVTSIGDYAFYNCSNLTSVTIPNSATSIGDCAFYNCSKLTSVTIPNSVTSIGYDAFKNCSSLTSITIPYGITSIYTSAFEGCSSLTNLTMYKNLTSIGNNAFNGCSSLTKIYFSGTKAQWNDITKDSNWNYNTGRYTIYCAADYATIY